MPETPDPVLVLAPNWLGDAVMALPAIAGVRRHFAAARLVVAARRGVADLFRSAADRFPTLRVAFNRLSDQVFFPNMTTPEKILRSM